MNNDLQYVYKYVDNSSKVVYVGITNNLKKRIYQHKHDKLKEIKNPVIYYFPVKYRADADMLETYLINYYGTVKYYNVSKTKKGDVSFLDICDDLPWNRYFNNIDSDLIPFVVSDILKKKKEVIVEKKIFVNEDSIDGKIQKIHDAMDFERNMVIDLIDYEEKVVNTLQSFPNYQKYPAIVKGIQLHKKRWICARLLKKYGPGLSNVFDRDRGIKREWLNSVMDKIVIELELHEKPLLEKYNLEVLRCQ